ncbi:MAG: redoxin family protein [Anaerolineae bacterium]|nr:redoxin family protein [Phycisphaerae bacterium]
MYLLVALILAGASSLVAAGGKYGEEAPEFPPGVFNDGRQYRLEDFRGKTVVLFFYEKDCPRCRGSIPDRNKVVQAYKDKPVKFIAIGAGDTLAEAKSYAGQTGLAMPVFSDSFSLMEKRYGQTISLNNIWQFRVVGPDGKVAGYKMELNEEYLEKAVAASTWKYKDQGYDAKLNPAIDLLEWGQYEQGVTKLRPFLKNANAEVAASAQKLFEALKTEGQQWMDEAAKAESENPIGAYDLYARTAATFAGDPLGEKAKGSLKAISAKQPVQDELAARKMYEGFVGAMAQSNPTNKTKLIELGKKIVQKYPSTPVANKVNTVLSEIGA